MTNKKMKIGSVTVFYDAKKGSIFWICLSEEIRRCHIFLNGDGQFRLYTPSLFHSTIV